MKTEAVIFDMDGVLIDSEPIWREAEVRIFGKFGIVITEEMCFQTTGMRVDEVVRYWSERLGNPEADPHEQIADEMVDEVIRLVRQKAVPMRGVREIIGFLRGMGMPLGLCSSSPLRLIDAVVDALGIRSAFGVIQSAEREEYGKPHPAVYIQTAKRMGIAPLHCLAIEDSVNGCVSAKAAKMRVMAVPESHGLNDKRYGIADWVVKDLEEGLASMAEIL